MALEMYDYVLFVFLLIAFFFDVKYNRLPNWLTVSGMTFGLLYHLITNGMDGLIFSVVGLLVAGIIFILLYIFRAIGAGDAKLFAAIGAIVGVEITLYLTMYSIVYAALIGIVILLFTKTFLRRLTDAFFTLVSTILSKELQMLEDYKVTRSTRFPFMYAVIPAVITTYYYYFLA
ncbi:A24 family peptidase [Lederbergia sp. NSJ-179]|uniref:A24 family peptidase n=1 Tax=Lederbergia sp. NSJ-179 TaxID=2931402 RepID=UPI001FD0C053|nr:A24 family peptidase [Lederbergia sp. NSJ-179]MCJ7840233.1 A24 family peptidase [Lederbergia sp. NSJ-179]